MHKFQGKEHNGDVVVLDETGDAFFYVDLERVDELIEALREGRKKATEKKA